MRFPTRTIPALADVTKDISGPLPAGLLDDWAASSDRSHDAARLLLAPYRREGTVVSSDTAGLTKMTQERQLLDVLWLVSEPMQILYAVGTAIGGQAVGVWEADNTEMLYPSTLPVGTVVDAMLEAQARIKERAAVKVGLCLHVGVFYEIGGGLFGGDAQLVEDLAENDAAGAEILVTNELVQRLQATADYGLLRRADLDELHAAGVFALRSSRRLPSLRENDAVYPHPFPPEFFAMLRDAARRAEATEAAAAGAELVDRFVVFLARKGAARSQENLASVLDELLVNDRMTRIVEESLSGSAELVETAGGLAIVVFDEGREAVAFARAVRERFREQSLPVSAGVDSGPMLVFPKAEGRTGAVAGDPINVASKISEDLGEAGRIRITERAAASMGRDGLGVDGERFEAMISGVRICGLIL
jgi:hypothetical protein